MTGPRILLLGLVLLGGLLWAALTQGDADLERGLALTDEAFAAVEAELQALEPPFYNLTRRARGLAQRSLGLKETHDQITGGLQALKAERKHIVRSDPDDPRARLPALLEVRDRTDQLLNMARGLHTQVDMRWEFIETSTPLLGESRALRDRLAAYDIEGTSNDVRIRVQGLAQSFDVAAGQAATADRTMTFELEQGRILGQATLNGLQGLIREQQILLAEIEGTDG
jgi:hypothetical protein